MPRRLFFARHPVGHRKPLETAALRLNTDKAHSLGRQCPNGALSSRRHTEPVAGTKRNHLAVKPDFARAGKDPVELFILLVRMHKGYGSASRQLIDGDFTASQSKLVMELRAGVA